MTYKKIYDKYLKKISQKPSSELIQIVEKYENGSGLGRLFGFFVGHTNIKYDATRALIAARENPEGEASETVNEETSSP